MNNDDNKNDAPTNTAPPTGDAKSADAAPTSEGPRYMTMEDFNGAVTARERRQEKRLEKLVAEALAAARGQAPPPADPDQAAALAALQALENDRKQQLAATEARERALLERELKSETEYELAALGCMNPRAARLILAEDGKITRNADGDLVFLDDKGEQVDLATGIKQWLHSTPEGRGHLPARGGGDGSGHIHHNNTRAVVGTVSKEEKKREAMRALNSFILGGRR
jgi:hypothetical protein